MLARRLFALSLLVPVLLACPRQEARESAVAEEVLEVEDVTLPVDIDLSTDQDAKGPPIIEGVSGLLPSDYPRDLPTYEPASIGEFGSTSHGRSFIEFDSPTAAATVVESLKGRLKRSGWQLEAAGQGRFRASKGGSDVSFEVTDLYSGSRIRVDY